MTPAAVVDYEASQRGALAEFLNEAYADIRALPGLGIEGPDCPEFTEGGLAQWEQNGAHIALAMEGDAIVSAAGWGRFGEEAVCDILFIGTAPAHRRRGHARELLRRCEAWARERSLEQLRTQSFVDSRRTAACGLLAACGFEVRDPEHMNITMQVDMDAWEPRVPELPEGYRIVRFQDGDEQAWADVQKAVFDGDGTEEWFRRRFRDRPNFDPGGWLFLERNGERVGITGAIVWFRDEAMTQPSGSLIEWVGVLPAERGKRLGEALMVAALNYLKGRDVYPNCLVTQYFRKPAVALYEKLGFRTVREWRTYVKPL